MRDHGRGQRRGRWLLGSAAAVIIIILTAASGGSAQQRGAAGGAGTPLERGKYLVSITGCHDCHSPKVKGGMTPDPDRPLSGRPSTTPIPSKADGEIHTALDLTAWTGPWGQSVASNLTPDKATGLLSKGYTEATFLQTMRSGKKPNGTQMQPPMPVDVYQNLTDDDLKAIWAYLQTLKPIRNAVLAAAPAPAK
jgi:cytochrome c553